MLVDLSHPLRSGMPVFPGTPDTSVEPLCTIAKDGFAEMALRLTTHTGTHIDAPCHVLRGAKSLDQFPLETFQGPAVVIDVTGADAIGLPAIQAQESRLSQVQFVLFRTGWAWKWGSRDYFDGFPVLTPEAAKWLAEFELKAVGFDAVSIDAVSNAYLPNHRTFLGREILILENLTNLQNLPKAIFELQCYPLAIPGADASPVRAVARW